MQFFSKPCPHSPEHTKKIEGRKVFWKALENGAKPRFRERALLKQKRHDTDIDNLIRKGKKI